MMCALMVSCSASCSWPSSLSRIYSSVTLSRSDVGIPTVPSKCSRGGEEEFAQLFDRKIAGFTRRREWTITLEPPQPVPALLDHVPEPHGTELREPSGLFPYREGD